MKHYLTQNTVKHLKINLVVKMLNNHQKNQYQSQLQPLQYLIQIQY